MNHKFLLCLFAFPITTISAMEKTPHSNKLERRKTVEVQKENKPQLHQHYCGRTPSSHCTGHTGDSLLQIQEQIKKGQVCPYAPF